MQNSKQWKNTGNGVYLFAVNNKQIGTIAINRGSLKRNAEITLGAKKFNLTKIGFWKTTTLIAEENGNIIMKVYPEKWYGNTFLIECSNKVYQLVFRNNPLAEFAITENGTDVLAYGLDTLAGKVGLKITVASNQPDYLFDFLLWYWFVPVATENIVESTGVFTTLLDAAAQL